MKNQFLALIQKGLGSAFSHWEKIEFSISSIFSAIYSRAVLTARDARWIAIFMPCYDYRA